MSKNCGTCFYWKKPSKRMVSGQCLYWQFMARPESGDAPFWSAPDAMPMAWKAASEGASCRAWDERDFDIAELSLPAHEAIASRRDQV